MALQGVRPGDVGAAADNGTIPPPFAAQASIAFWIADVLSVTPISLIAPYVAGRKDCPERGSLWSPTHASGASSATPSGNGDVHTNLPFLRGRIAFIAPLTRSTTQAPSDLPYFSTEKNSAILATASDQTEAKQATHESQERRRFGHNCCQADRARGRVKLVVVNARLVVKDTDVKSAGPTV